jgi:hypothetical protein
MRGKGRKEERKGRTGRKERRGGKKRDSRRGLECSVYLQLSLHDDVVFLGGLAVGSWQLAVGSPSDTGMPEGMT